MSLIEMYHSVASLSVQSSSVKRLNLPWDALLENVTALPAATKNRRTATCRIILLIEMRLKQIHSLIYRLSHEITCSKSFINGSVT